MGSTGEFKHGLVLNFKNELWAIVEFQHVKPGKGGAFVRTKLKNVKTGRVVENTFRSGENVDIVRIEEKSMQYLYQEGQHFIFMDNETYEQIPVSAEVVGDAQKYLKEGENCTISIYENNAIVLELPNFLNLRVTETEPVQKGDTVSGSGKPATLETGAVVQVPFFINIGELIRVDVRSNTYIERTKE